MKLIAYILLVSLVLMGTDRIMHGQQWQAEKVEMSCEMECCASQNDCEAEQESQDKHQCPPDCDCGCCFHITAMYYQFVSVPAAEFQVKDFAGYSNNYHFDYFFPHFQPPRLA